MVTFIDEVPDIFVDEYGTAHWVYSGGKFASPMHIAKQTCAISLAAISAEEARRRGNEPFLGANVIPLCELCVRHDLPRHSE